MKNLIICMATLWLSILSVNRSQAQFQYIFPKDGSFNNFRETHLILRNGELMDGSSVTADKVTLTGSKSGVIPARVVLARDGINICITPLSEFAYTENVTVNVKEGFKLLSGLVLTGTTFSFSIRRERTAEEQKRLDEYLSTHDEEGNLLNDPNQQSTYVPNTNADTRGTPLSSVIIYTNNNPSPGQIFFHRNSAILPQGYGIMESNGDSVFYRHSNVDGSNFQINLNGYLTAYHLNYGVDTGVILLDSQYNIIDTVYCGNGLAPSQHEHLFFPLPDGSKWFTIYDWQEGYDLSACGQGTATVNVSWIQALDADNEVTYEWRSDEHFSPCDAASDIVLSASVVDPWHINTLFKDVDGNFIVGLRNCDLTFKLNTSNDQILWYWGKSWTNNPNYSPMITNISDPDGVFSHPHHIHRIANGHILLFDNGNLNNQPNPYSQPKEYILDETNYTATCTWYYIHPTVNGFNMWTKQQGSVTRMPNGNTFIGYGLPNVLGLPNGTEIDANKNIVWEFRFKDSSEYSYRLYKYLWDPSVGIGSVNGTENHVEVFPTPSNGLVTLNMDIPAAGEVEIEVLNLLGQVVYSKTENSGFGIHSETLDLSKLETGFYVLHVSSGKTKMVGRILIQ